MTPNEQTALDALKSLVEELPLWVQPSPQEHLIRVGDVLRQANKAIATLEASQAETGRDVDWKEKYRLMTNKWADALVDHQTSRTAIYANNAEIVEDLRGEIEELCRLTPHPTVPVTREMIIEAIYERGPAYGQDEYDGLTQADIERVADQIHSLLTDRVKPVEVDLSEVKRWHACTTENGGSRTRQGEVIFVDDLTNALYAAGVMMK